MKKIALSALAACAAASTLVAGRLADIFITDGWPDIAAAHRAQQTGAAFARNGIVGADSYLTLCHNEVTAIVVVMLLAVAGFSGVMAWRPRAAIGNGHR